MIISENSISYLLKQLKANMMELVNILFLSRSGFKSLRVRVSLFVTTSIVKWYSIYLPSRDHQFESDYSYFNNKLIIYIARWCNGSTIVS